MLETFLKNKKALRIIGTGFLIHFQWNIIKCPRRGAIFRTRCGKMAVEKKENERKNEEMWGRIWIIR